MIKKRGHLRSLIRQSAIALGLLSSAGSYAASPDTAGLTPCYTKGLADRLMCGSVEQPLSANNSEKISIHFAVIPAIKQVHPTEAIMAFAGGPGQSAIEVAAVFARVLRYAREERDIILVDQRGTGKSTLLQCDMDPLEAQFAFNDDALPIFEYSREETQKCKSKLNTDLSHFTTVAAASDFEAVRKALGYQKLHLFGASYGTRIAQEYMRRYPQAVASATLDGVVPMQQSLVAIGDAIDDSLQAIFSDCANKANCRGQYPQLEQQYQMLLTQLEAQPASVQVPHPRTHNTIPLVLTQSKVRSAIRMALYSHTTRALVPLAISEAAKGNYLPLVGLMGSDSGFGSLAMGMHSAIVCAEDWPLLTEQARARFSASYFGRMMIESLDASCPVWQVEAVGKDFYQPLSTDIPTLLLSGGLDPATPPGWAELAMVKMKNARHLVAEQATHGVAAQSCADKLVAEFINHTEPKELDASCLEKAAVRRYFMNPNGPAVASQEP
ncbi:alpha/beta hydrolase [Pseudoalteromonas sp. DL2-H2.2]|uniref:alpha/beta hydrolase n=1 Tax=Pseudoalteromonas sp. DL2-H2.2 TaxID=2908889 RepID=UPI001F3FB6D6|nr:alpha/beta hydrolase [Pseudoalteromonas sp. DL2-H2.2]MCF2908242.1 alpha/beta hydrolase [Pseudoalteromonas sp. DL2-H2.2]